MFPNCFLLVLLGEPNVYPGQMGYIIPPVYSCSAPLSLHHWTWPEHLKREASWRQPNQKPEPLRVTPFNTKKQPIYSELVVVVRAPNAAQTLCKGNSNWMLVSTVLQVIIQNSWQSWGFECRWTGESESVWDLLPTQVSRALLVPGQSPLHSLWSG